MSNQNKISISNISLKIIFRDDLPKYVIDFFEKGIDNDQIPAILKTYRFTFDNSCNIAGKTQMLFQQDKVGNYHLSINHQFNFNNPDEATKGYWFTGGLGQYAQDNLMAGYISHESGSIQLFGYQDKMVFFGGSKIYIDFSEKHTTQKGFLEREDAFDIKRRNILMWSNVLSEIFENATLVKQCEIVDKQNHCVVNLRTDLENIKFSDYIEDEYISRKITTAENNVYYEDIEYIEFLKFWDDERIGMRIEPKKITQDTTKIKEILDELYGLKWSETENSIRINKYTGFI